MDIERYIRAETFAGYRVGHHMRSVVAYVSRHPGCSILDCARHASTARGGHRWTYAAVHRAERAGLIELVRAKGRAGYALYLWGQAPMEV